MLRSRWKLYSPAEKRNIAIYILGIMFYKLGLEFFDGSITALALDRWGSTEHSRSEIDFKERARVGYYGKLGTARGLNQAAQYVGAILAAPLIDKFPMRTVLTTAALFFGLMASTLLIIDAVTGGKMLGPLDGKAQDTKDQHREAQYGKWNPDVIFPIWMFSGVACGMVELIRRVIPRDIVGGNAGKLRCMGAITHVFYEAAGTIAAIGSSYAIQRFGANYSYFLTPVFFAIAGAIWSFITILGPRSSRTYTSVPLEEIDRRRSLVQVFYWAISYLRSAWLVAVSVSMVWLILSQGLFPSYALAFYLHRFLENSLAPTFANSILDEPRWSQILVAGSNIGELIGALSVLLLSDIVTTPIPWLRFNALMLNVIWILPYFSTVAVGNFWAWRIAGCLIPISWGWAAGDVSLVAYIQSALSSQDYVHKFVGVSPLAAVMAFLYSSYIVINAILSSQLGRILDKWDKYDAFVQVGGIQYSVCCAIIFFATFIPKGSFGFNPKAIEGVTAEGEPEIREPISLDDEFSRIKLMPRHSNTPTLKLTWEAWAGDSA